MSEYPKMVPQHDKVVPDYGDILRDPGEGNYAICLGASEAHVILCDLKSFPTYNPQQEYEGTFEVKHLTLTTLEIHRNHVRNLGRWFVCGADSTLADKIKNQFKSLDLDDYRAEIEAGCLDIRRLSEQLNDALNKSVAGKSLHDIKRDIIEPTQTLIYQLDSQLFQRLKNGKVNPAVALEALLNHEPG